MHSVFKSQFQELHNYTEYHVSPNDKFYSND